MPVAANKPGATEGASSRQLGLGLMLEARPAPAIPANAVPSPVLPLPVPVRGEPPAAVVTQPRQRALEDDDSDPVSVPPSSPSTETARAPRIFKVGELVRAARLTLESRFAEVRVDGEVSGF